jgi:hypothetical protein
MKVHLVSDHVGNIIAYSSMKKAMKATKRIKGWTITSYWVN